MTKPRRAAVVAALAVATLGILPSGCALIPPLLYWHSKSTSGAAATSDGAIVASGTAWFNGSVGAAVTLPTNPLGNSNPLTAVEPLANVIPLTAVEPLANVIPLTAVEPLTVVEPYRILSRSVQADAPALFVEAIDLATGNLLKRRLGGSYGKFELRYVPPAGAKGVIVQATVVYGGKVSGFLCSPLSIASVKGTQNADLTYGSTSLALSDALLAGVRTEFDVATGFRKFKTSQLADTVGLRDAAITAKAAAALDGADSLAKVTDVSTALANITEAARTLAAKAGDLIAQESRSIDVFTAAAEAILAKLPEIKLQAGAALAAAISDAAAGVDLSAFKARVGEVRVRREEVEARAGTSTTTPAPAVTAAPAPEVTATPQPAQGGALQGVMRDAETGLAVRDRAVRLGSAATRTDAVGAFAFFGVPAGTASLEVETSLTSTFSMTVSRPAAGDVKNLGVIAVTRTHWFPQSAPVSTRLTHVNVISEKVAYAAGPGGTLLRTLDGASWATTSAGITGDVAGVAIGVGGGLVVTPDGLFGTRDQGASWEKVSAAMGGSSLAIDGGDKTVFVNKPNADGAGIKRSDVNGSGMATPAATGLDIPLLTLTLSSAPGRTLFGNGAKDVYASADDGATWTKLAAPPLDFQVEAAHPLLAGSATRIFAVGAGTVSGGQGIGGILAESDDGGAKWRTTFTASNSFGHAEFMAIRPRGNSFAVVGACSGIFSQVGGSTLAKAQISKLTGCGRALFDVGFAPDLSVGWAVGDDGTILNYVRDID